MTADLPCNTWVNLNLSTFLDETDLFGSGSTAAYSGGLLQGLTGTFGQWRFAIPALYLPTDRELVTEITFADAGHDPGTGHNTFLNRILASVDPAIEAGITDDGGSLANYLVADYTTGSGGVAVATYTVGPGVYDPDDFGFQAAFDSEVAGLGYRYVLFGISFGSGTEISAIRVKKLCPSTIIPPLRQYPRSDGLGASSVRRLWPPPPTIQASNRRGPSAIL